MRETAHIFWDNSNIFITAKAVAAQKEGGPTVTKEIRINFDHLFTLARAGREVIGGIAVGSGPPDLRALWARLRGAGIQVELYERGQMTGTEQGVDQCLQVHMLRALADAEHPGVAVLLTGDGKGYEDGVGFHADLERMVRKGWGIEVLSWTTACNKRLKAWAESVGVYVPLEDYYDSITFREGGRLAKPVSLKHRKRAVPRQHVPAIEEPQQVLINCEDPASLPAPVVQRRP